MAVRGRGLHSSRWKLFFLGLFAVGAITMATLALQGQTPEAAEGSAQSWPVLTLDEDRPVAVFLGGSSAAGGGSSDEVNRWSSILSEARGWEEANLARNGTGYLIGAQPDECGQPTCPNIRDALAEAVEAGPGIVVISGGEFDQAEDFETVNDAVRTTYQGLRVGLPNASIIAVGPVSTVSEPTAPIVAIDAAVQREAAAIGATYVSLLAPNVLSRAMLSADGAVINDAGHAAIAARIAAALN
ncbi:SGNH/GDSL hydrolase family protein [Cryobacterium cryoconiti]|uniref:SGNH/GDSL hydrolase family protein n=1 Tax=Cryobacterium cryoconiti TaxID=1259239 RepID=A0A4Y8JWB1_9MICO|nr:SGNH/GDSL hydrolase family protein [Cryobacterium cryoconiti]TFD31736.1 SGNH/GDSL hydrolase family protein [Cryobacterium cryoconiti]